jgi:hypothetical protein
MTLSWCASAAAPPKSEPFEKQVAPFLAKHCVHCHGPTKQNGGIAFNTFTNTASVLKDRKTWQKVLHVLQARAMPPRKRPQPAQEEVDAVTAWIQAATKIDCTGPHEPGRVTLRRLNRAEYNNTIRDLVGVDFQPADDFPSDDVGYGFDNIGDVLSLPPILLEKYLAAAERITELAIVIHPRPKATVRKFVAEELNSTVKNSRQYNGSRKLFTNGEAFIELPFSYSGDYEVRVRAYGEQAGPEPARMAVRLDGKDLRVIDVKAVAKAPKVYKVKTKIQAGNRRLAVAFINDYYNPKDPDPKNRDRNLIIEHVEIEGPVNAPPVPLPESHKRIFLCQPTPATKTECARKILENFARRAYRRPVSLAEVDRLVGLVRQAEAQGDTFEKGIQLAVQAVLVSPHFLFRVELDRPPTRPDGAAPVGDYELASRLSYFLWSSMPDEELFECARTGTLRDDRTLQIQVRRLLNDAKAKALVENFAGQWLQLRNLKTVAPDRKRFRAFNNALRSAMQRETELFFEAIVKEDRSVLDFLDADFTFLNEPLARHYGIEEVKGNEFRRVSLTGSQRGGILTQASILTITSNPTRTSPVKRGKWILENILGTPPPPPPPDAGELKDDKKSALTGTLRQRMEQHRANPLCASCHQRMDPLGFGFENFDAIGAWRTQEGTFTIDSSGTLPSGETFHGPVELKAILKRKEAAFRRCLTEKLLTYALGRGLEDYDQCAVDAICRKLADGRDTFSRLVIDVVGSDPFQMRRGKPGDP